MGSTCDWWRARSRRLPAPLRGGGRSYVRCSAHLSADEISEFLTWRSSRVTAAVSRVVAGLAEHGLRSALDVFTPALAPSVGRRSCFAREPWRVVEVHDLLRRARARLDALRTARLRGLVGGSRRDRSGQLPVWTPGLRPTRPVRLGGPDRGARESRWVGSRGRSVLSAQSSASTQSRSPMSARSTMGTSMSDSRPSAPKGSVSRLAGNCWPSAIGELSVWHGY